MSEQLLITISQHLWKSFYGMAKTIRVLGEPRGGALFCLLWINLKKAFSFAQKEKTFFKDLPKLKYAQLVVLTLSALRNHMLLSASPKCVCSEPVDKLDEHKRRPKLQRAIDYCTSSGPRESLSYSGLPWRLSKVHGPGEQWLQEQPGTEGAPPPTMTPTPQPLS